MTETVINYFIEISIYVVSGSEIKKICLDNLLREHSKSIYIDDIKSIYH